jgi:hypothetical protein
MSLFNGYLLPTSATTGEGIGDILLYGSEFYTIEASIRLADKPSVEIGTATIDGESNARVIHITFNAGTLAPATTGTAYVAYLNVYIKDGEGNGQKVSLPTILSLPLTIATPA